MGIWEELLIGEGFWLGLLLQESLLFTMSSLVPRFSLFAGCYSLLMFIYYFDNIASNTFEIWGVIFVGMCAILYFFMSIND